MKRLFALIMCLAFFNVSYVYSENIVYQDWQKEAAIATSFAQRGEFEEAISTYKRALVLLPTSQLKDYQQIEYAITLSYFLSQKYDQVIKFFEKSNLLYTSKEFEFYRDLMLMLFESYEKLNQRENADHILAELKNISELDAYKMQLTSSIYRKDLAQIDNLVSHDQSKSYISKLLKQYKEHKKSPKIAKTLSIICPGLGYLYAGQKRSAITAFILNALLITASSQLFLSHYYTLGFLTSSFELGWYVGGIYGANRAVDVYNEHLFKDYGEKVLFQEELFPAMSLENVF